MRLALGLIVPLFSGAVLAFGCGETANNSDNTAGAAGLSTAAGVAGSASAGSSNGGTSTGGGSAGHGGSSSGGASGAGGTSTGGSSEAGSSAGGSGPVDCDPHQVLCRIVAPDCPQGEVPRVKGTCYGECVKIDRCSCTSAEQCPEPEQYTCLRSPMHCSYYLE